jgi:HPt (histidine-containing phosphotransfer) domain-containing protein
MTLPLIDPRRFEALQANAGADFVLTLIEAFAEEAPGLVTQLRRASADDDAHAFESAAHTLKSNGVAFGAVRFAEMARALEWQGLTSDTSAIDAVAATLSATLAALRAMAHT